MHKALKMVDQLTWPMLLIGLALFVWFSIGVKEKYLDVVSAAPERIEVIQRQLDTLLEDDAEQIPLTVRKVDKK